MTVLAVSLEAGLIADCGMRIADCFTGRGIRIPQSAIDRGTAVPYNTTFPFDNGGQIIRSQCARPSLGKEVRHEMLNLAVEPSG
jgi:hypothetical protein